MPSFAVCPDNSRPLKAWICAYLLLLLCCWYVYFDWYWFTLFVYAFVLALVTLAMDVLCDLAVLSNY